MVEEHKDAGHHGFMLGILIGILIALLFTTQKGRKLLKVITTEGSRKIGNWDELIEVLQREIGEDAAIEEEPVVGEDLKEEVKEGESSKKTLQQAQDEEVEEKESEGEATPEPEKIEKIDTEHLEQEIAEIKEEIKEVKEDQEEEKPAPKKKSRLFKGIRRK